MTVEHILVRLQDQLDRMDGADYSGADLPQLAADVTDALRLVHTALALLHHEELRRVS